MLLTHKSTTGPYSDVELIFTVVSTGGGISNAVLTLARFKTVYLSRLWLTIHSDSSSDVTQQAVGGERVTRWQGYIIIICEEHNPFVTSVFASDSQSAEAELLKRANDAGRAWQDQK